MTDYPVKLLQLVSESVLEFFTSTGFPSAIQLKGPPAAAANDAELYAASLGFSGEGLKGALVLIAAPALLAATNPQREFVERLGEADHADWIGEIANQILGALKRRAAGYKVDFSLSTPTVVRGAAMSLAKATKSQPAAPFWFEVNGQRMQVDFAAALGPNAVFEGEPEAAGQAASGDTFLF